MKAPDPLRLRLHEDAEFFRESVSYTAARTGFLARLVEKDYYCTVLLQYLAAAAPELVFKGGTCLAKVHLGFYRLSEDLDFVIPVQADIARGERSRRTTSAKKVIGELERFVAELKVVSALTGSNSSTQYAAEIRYESVLGTRPETIKVEIGLREPLLLPHDLAPAHTLLLDPFSGAERVPAFGVPCIASFEGMAEKLRAALTRRDPAIRDFYDVDHAIRAGRLDVTDRTLLGLVRSKLEVAGNAPVDVTPERLSALRRQIAAQLRPVLREPDFTAFDLDRAFAVIEGIAATVRPQ
jgi:predicted nucleotidyltransferase component of viral defense system